MEGQLSEVRFKEATIADISSLHQLIVESTSGKTELTVAKLKSDLFKSTKPEEVKSSGEADIIFDLESLKSDSRNVRATLAISNNELIGYVIYHYHYSPWTGHCAFVNDIFVVAGHRREGIAKKLLMETRELMKKDGLRIFSFMFTTENISNELMDVITRHDCVWLRNSKTDWSVLRIQFKHA